MLSNNDFKSLIGSTRGKSNVIDGSSNTRFDLKTISSWDRQIHAKMAEKSKSKKRSSFESSGKTDNESGNKYRDRALERRKNVEVDELEAIAATLEPEQTKYLGGDVEHTHLVKGIPSLHLSAANI